MKTLLLALCVLSLPLAAPLVSAADGATTTMPAMDCCNAKCPVCDMPIDKTVHPVPFMPSDGVKQKNAGIDHAMVGFCSEKCHLAYAKDPAKYEDKIVPQWQQSKTQPVKGG